MTEYKLPLDKLCLVLFCFVLLRRQAGRVLLIFLSLGSGNVSLRKSKKRRRCNSKHESRYVTLSTIVSTKTNFFPHKNIMFCLPVIMLCRKWRPVPVRPALIDS